MQCSHLNTTNLDILCIEVQLYNSTIEIQRLLQSTYEDLGVYDGYIDWLETTFSYKDSSVVDAVLSLFQNTRRITCERDPGTKEVACLK